MKSVPPSNIDPNNRRPRLAVVIPLLGACFAAIYFIVRDYMNGPVPETRAQARTDAVPIQTSDQPHDVAAQRRDFRANPRPLARPALPSLVPPANESLDSEETEPIDPSSARSPQTTPNLKASSVRVDLGSQITGRITLKGTPPPERAVPLDASCGRLHTNSVTTRFYLVDDNGGLADVFVYIKDGMREQHFRPPALPALLDQVGCEYRPYVLGLQTGQKLLVRNSDPLLHNVHATPVVPGNQESNRAQSPNAKDLEFVFPNPEVFLRFKCDVHVWMFAYVSVVNHPFFSVSASDGTFRLSNLPAGHYNIEACHRKAGRATREITVREHESATLDFVFEVPSSDN